MHRKGGSVEIEIPLAVADVCVYFVFRFFCLAKLFSVKVTCLNMELSAY